VRLSSPFLIVETTVDGVGCTLKKHLQLTRGDLLDVGVAQEEEFGFHGLSIELFKGQPESALISEKQLHAAATSTDKKDDVPSKRVEAHSVALCQEPIMGFAKIHSVHCHMDML
jgi:hypothetical protein